MSKELLTYSTLNIFLVLVNSLFSLFYGTLSGFDVAGTTRGANILLFSVVHPLLMFRLCVRIYRCFLHKSVWRIKPFLENTLLAHVTFFVLKKYAVTLYGIIAFATVYYTYIWYTVSHTHLRWSTRICRDPKWTLNDHVKSLFSKHKCWRTVYWLLWSECHFMRCSRCRHMYPIKNQRWCQFHTQSPQYHPVENNRYLHYPIGTYTAASSVVTEWGTVRSTVKLRQKNRRLHWKKNAKKHYRSMMVYSYDNDRNIN